MEKLTDFRPPVDLGEVNIHLDEVMYYLYLPIKHPGTLLESIPDDRLWKIIPLLEEVCEDNATRYHNSYVYLTVKKMFVGGGVTANRPGWHCDGFLSDDLNYIWFDSAPTVFTKGKFAITPDHLVSLNEFDLQARDEDEYLGKPGHLYKLDDRVIHRVNTDIPHQIMRTFIKITVSKNRFNLKDNSKNPLLPDDGPFFERALVRNDPHQAQSDVYIPRSPKDDHFA